MWGTSTSRYPPCTHLLKAAGTTASITAARPDETDDITAHVVCDHHVEFSQITKQVPRAAVILLLSPVHALSDAVQYDILIVGLEASDCWIGIKIKDKAKMSNFLVNMLKP